MIASNSDEDGRDSVGGGKGCEERAKLVLVSPLDLCLLLDLILVDISRPSSCPI